MKDKVWTIEKLAKYILKRLNKDWDCVIAVTGMEGVGKSTLAYLLGQAINGKIFDLKQHVLFYPKFDVVNDKYEHSPKHSAFVWDEAITLLYKLNWATKKSKSLNEAFAINRALNMATILCIPRFTDLNEFFRNHRVALWIHVVGRGKAVVTSKDWSRFSRDCWHFKDNDKYMAKKQRQKSMSAFSINEKLRLESDTIGFEAYLNFDPLPEDEAEEYKKYKNELRVKLSTEKTQEKTDDRKAMCFDLVDRGITDSKELSTILRRSVRSINEYKQQYAAQKEGDTQKRVATQKRIAGEGIIESIISNRISRDSNLKEGELSS